MANHGMTAKGAATKARIVEGAAALIREQGPAETSLDEILAATSTSKSQLFHYFPDGRKDLLLTVAEHEAGQVLAAQEPYLSDLTSCRKWQAWRKAVVEYYRDLGSRCPLGALTAQLGKTSPETRQIVSELYDTWEQRLLTGTRAILGPGRGPGGLSAAQVARAILVSIQGGVLMLQVTGSIAYLETGLSAALEPLRPSAVSSG